MAGFQDNEQHSINFNSVFNLANGRPEDELRELSLGRRSVFDSQMRSWVGGLNYDFRTKGDRFLNSVTVRYYMYKMDTKKSSIYGEENIRDVNLSQNDFGVSNAMRYKFNKNLMGKLSAGYDVRIPSETELLGDGYSISPSENLTPERNTSVNIGLLYDDKEGTRNRNIQIEANCPIPPKTNVCPTYPGCCRDVASESNEFLALPFRTYIYHHPKVNPRHWP